MIDTRRNLCSEARKRVNRNIQAPKNATQGVWFGLGMMGLIGWSIVVPALVGAAIGYWLDLNHAGQHIWVLILLVSGLLFGCFNAWLWVVKEQKAMNNDKDKHDQ